METMVHPVGVVSTKTTYLSVMDPLLTLYQIVKPTTTLLNVIMKD